MERDTEHISPVQQFLIEYRKELDSLHENAWEVFDDCYRGMGLNYPHDYFVDIGKKIRAMENFCDIETKSQELQLARGRCYTEFCQHARGPAYDESLEKFNIFQNIIQEIINRKDSYLSISLDNARAAYEKIRVCPFGENANRTTNALLFQEKVLEFVDWLFISEFERIDLKEIEKGHLRRDGVYKVLDGFVTLNRCGFNFNHLFIECKNFRKPNYLALMQVFIYTLSCEESEISKVPLSLLVSRENPDVESTVWKIRRAIFNKPMSKETRLILFLDEKDLAKMLNYKMQRIDPALALKGKIDELVKSNIKYGGV